MSYDIEYKNQESNNFVLDEPIQEGGTQVLGGNPDSWMNVTYNYSWYFYQFLDKKEGIRWLYGKKGKDCIERLKKAIKPFEEDQPYEKDYWANTPGNCVRPLKIFLSWCEKWPEGVFEGD